MLALFAYSNSFRGAFVFDDLRSIRDNPELRDLGRALGPAGYRANPNRWFAFATFALNHRLGGLDPAGYHAANLAIHVLAAALLYALVVLTFRTPRLRGSALAGSAPAVGFAAAALFATHPIQTQAVTYVVQRLTSLAAVLYLLTVVLYALWRLRTGEGRWRGWRGGAGYAAILLAALLAVRTKEIAFTLPAAVLLYELCFFGREGRRLLLLLPLAAAALMVPLSLLDVGRPLGQILADGDAATRVQTAMGRLDYLRTELAVVATYLRLLVVPVGQNLDHDFPVFHSFLAPRVLLSAALLAFLAAAAAWLHRRSVPAPGRRELDPAVRIVSFGVAWFFLALLVESSLIPIADVIYEHRVYLPSMGLFSAAAAGTGLLARRLSAEAAPRLLVLVALLVSLPLASATLQRNAVWADDVSLWADAVSKSPAKFRPHLNLGTALATSGRPREGLRELRRALEIDPRSGLARTQVGAALLSLGRPAEAEPELREAVRLEPEDPTALFNLAVSLSATGRADEAREWYRRFLAVAPPGYEAARRFAATRAGPR